MLITFLTYQSIFAMPKNIALRNINAKWLYHIIIYYRDVAHYARAHTSLAVSNIDTLVMSLYFVL